MQRKNYRTLIWLYDGNDNRELLKLYNMPKVPSKDDLFNNHGDFYRVTDVIYSMNIHVDASNYEYDIDVYCQAINCSQSEYLKSKGYQKV